LRRWAGLGGDQLIDGVDGGGEEHGVPLLAGGVTEGGGEVRLTQPDATGKNDIRFLGNEAEAEEVLHLGLVDLLRPVPAELVEGLDHGEARGAHSAFHGALLAHGTLAVEEALEELEVGPRGGRRFLGQRGVMRGDVREFEIMELVGEGGHEERS
jgi:hypothetical protein